MNDPGTRVQRRWATGLGSAVALTAATVAWQTTTASAAPNDPTWACPTTLTEPGELRWTNSPGRSGAVALDGAAFTKAAKPVIFLRTPEAADPGGTSRIEFKLDELDDSVADCSLNPRADESGVRIDGSFFAYDFNGGTDRRATGFSFSQLNAGETYTITTQRTTYPAGSTTPTVVYARATFTVTA